MQVHERTGKLDEALEEIAVGAGAILKPQRLEDVVCLVELLIVEAAQVADEVRVVFAGLDALDALHQRRDLVILFAHQRSLAGKNSAIKSS